MPIATNDTTTPRVLLVEHHADTASMMKRVLASAGCDVSVARDCAEALALAGIVRFDLVVCDEPLPDGDGCDLFRTLLGRYGIPGIACTANAYPGDADRYLNAGFTSVLVKPIAIETLAARVKEAVSRTAGR